MSDTESFKIYLLFILIFLSVSLLCECAKTVTCYIPTSQSHPPPSRSHITTTTMTTCKKKILFMSE